MKTIKVIENENGDIELLQKEEGNHRLLSNFIIEFNCKFIDSAKTLKGGISKFNKIAKRNNLI